jgi:hypothetical protein
MCGSRALRTTETKDENSVCREDSVCRDGELSESCEEFHRLQPLQETMEFSRQTIKADSGAEEEKFEAPYRDES